MVVVVLVVLEVVVEAAVVVALSSAWRSGGLVVGPTDTHCTYVLCPYIPVLYLMVMFLTFRHVVVILGLLTSRVRHGVARLPPPRLALSVMDGWPFSHSFTSRFFPCNIR